MDNRILRKDLNWPFIINRMERKNVSLSFSKSIGGRVAWLPRVSVCVCVRARKSTLIDFSSVVL